MDRRLTLSRTTKASLAVFGIGILWGLYWLPVRKIDTLGVPGAWGTLAITLAAMLILAPVAWQQRQVLRHADHLALLAVAMGGAAFTLYSVGFIYGRVALVTLLFYLTPVWSTLFARYILGWDTPRLRMIAMGVGLAGLLIMLGAKGDAPIPRNIGEWMGLASGLLWAIGSTGIRVRPEIAPIPAAFIFAAGGFIAAIICILILPATPITVTTSAALIALATGALWWGVSIPLLMWATARLDPARVGMLLMSEVLIGITSASIIAGEHISALELIGGALVLFAGLAEFWPQKEKTGPP